jgi:multiple sugar transport system permease protein
MYNAKHRNLLGRVGNRLERKYFVIFMLPSIVGVFVFILYPFADVVRRSFTTVMTGEFVALDNYKKVIHNQAFMLALKNTLHFSLVAIPLLILIGLIFSLILSRLGDVGIIKTLYLFPMALPIATVVIVWRMFFYKQDFNSLVASYIWKNIGFTIILCLAGIVGIPNDVIEAAKVDGAGRLRIIWSVKLPLLRDSLYVVVILSVLNSFKIYREVYLVAGAYPKQEIYMLQNIFNNWYVNMEFDKLSAATVMFGGVLCVFVFLLLKKD